MTLSDHVRAILKILECKVFDRKFHYAHTIHFSPKGRQLLMKCNKCLRDWVE